ncbi:hypothetical protein T492DRAFT_887129 [Pavlovales sp. CCMP2436]|nr:hypothetical protein T492DRAFT_887129 [Pavlovales sp. CCMP2436]
MALAQAYPYRALERPRTPCARWFSYGWRVRWLLGSVAALLVLRELREYAVGAGGLGAENATFREAMRLEPLESPRALVTTGAAQQQALFDDLQHWMLLNGAILPLAKATRVGKVRYGDVLVRGLIASAPLANNALLTSIPARLLLSRESAMVSELAVPLVRERLSPFVSLGARERREPGSGWAPFMRLAASSHTMRGLAQRHARTVAATFAALQQRAPDALQLAGNVSLADFSRAWDLVMSRFWLLSGHAIMVPYVELLNFGEDPNSCELILPDKGKAGAVAPGAFALARFDFTLRQNYRVGEEVRFFYNQHCAEEYMLYYGFSLPGAAPCKLDTALTNYWFVTMLGEDGSARLDDPDEAHDAGKKGD